MGTDQMHLTNNSLMRFVSMLSTVNVRVYAASIDKPHLQFGSANFGKK